METTNETALLSGPLADRSTWTTDRCSLAGALSVIGTRSAFLIMREAFYGTSRFEDFAHRVGITEAVTAARLKELSAAGLLERRPYKEPGQRTRAEYVLTQAGRDLLPVAVALMQWGDTYASRVPGGPLNLVHDGCGAEVRARVMCADGHEVPLHELRVRIAEGQRPDSGGPNQNR